MALGIAAVAAVAGAAVGYALRGPGTAPERPALTLEITTPPTDDPTATLSPDGGRIAFVANQNRVPMLWVRPLDSSDPQRRIFSVQCTVPMPMSATAAATPPITTPRSSHRPGAAKAARYKTITISINPCVAVGIK